MEFLNSDMITACNSYSDLDLKVAPTLFFEFIGSPVRGMSVTLASYSEPQIFGLSLIQSQSCSQL